MNFSFIIPVYNRPEEIEELLESLTKQTYKESFDIIIVEDGSTIPCEHIVDKYKSKLAITYYLKYNSGPGDSRNFGMSQSKSDYFIILDSDCIIPENYLTEVSKSLSHKYVDCYGGPDAMLPSFSAVQKAINFTMTSVITTGGIRGGSEKIEKFQPRSFNMGISRKAFEASKGFSNIHPGEDPDLSIRLWKLGFETKLITSAFVYHKRRIDWEKFYIQVNKFGKARPILNHWYPEYAKATFFLPSIFVIGFIVGVVSLIFTFDWILKLYFAYTILIFIMSSIQNKNIYVGYLSIIAVWKQFFGYGLGFIESFFKINILKEKPQEAFPELFFKI
ncbi:Glycosyltransferase, catalytic subunit of cellulose synthase and poly-beta-1,6-N-acetylglucosamine synthase [Flavobacterium swingsii]|jgi:glycosyltransferase involved in cell wall biosynthesis|uniref:Glycosyltransferase, catalytic subunit of cellulose synthase and poly-beta-1,6-N-acetylglucosamine synthase n=1 Tax=Flavobacterium swingsii TaxID=498292 RepID=A0A1I0WML3_9FLAO|nr:glycosyltransferase [Flavobacterium swingsii]SFA89410.1 Glycosyltransferase, catalytic subunit of cellulose synthase and poly-beta-1,6-N-acetylglucosamine synthase [Flavobacterium swingsii]